MKTTRIAAVLATGLALLSPRAGAAVVDTEWWKVDFESPTPTGVDHADQPAGGINLEVGVLGPLTNTYNQVLGTVAPYATGIWKMTDGDESYVTNGIVTNFVDGALAEVASGTYLNLDTQGGDLVWEPDVSTNENAIALVDADLRLVGSDSEPDPTDFDGSAAEPVQTAIFLKNFLDEDDGETTNSLLCVYAYDTGTGQDVWQELDGVAIEDGSWHHVQVLVNYTGEQPKVEVYVDGTKMHALGDATTAQWTVAHANAVKNIGKLQTVSFRGTGAVDNFAGTVRKESFAELTFAAEVYMNGTKVATGTTDNTTRYKVAEAGDAGSGKTVTFTGFNYHDFSLDDPDTAPTYCLRKIEVTDFATGSTAVYNYDYNEETKQIIPETDVEGIEFDTMTIEDGETGEEMELFYGPFDVTVLTDGATDPTNTVVKLYFKTLGAFDVNAISKDSTGKVLDTATVSYVAGSIPADETHTFTLPESRTVNGSNFVLRAISAPLAGSNGVARTASGYTVAIPIDQTWTTDQNAVEATYAFGDWTGKYVDMVNNGNGSWSIDGGVARIGNAYYESLQAALNAVPVDGEEPTTVELLVDIELARNVSVAAGKNVFLDLGGNTVEAAAHAIANWGTLAVTNGTVVAAGAAVYNAGEGASATIWDGEYTSETWSAVANYADGASVTIHGGNFQSQEMTVAIRAANTTTVIDGGTFTALDNAVVGTNGTNGLGGNTITITGGHFFGGIQTAGYIACGIYLANNDTLTFGGDAEMTITGGAGIVARAGAAQVGVEGGSITTTGTATGWVGDSKVALPCAAIVYDTSAGYPGLGENASLSVSGGTFISLVEPIVQVKAEGDATVLSVSGGSFSDVVPADYCATGYVPVTTPVNGLYTVGHGVVQIEIDGQTRTFGSILDAQIAASAAEIADPVFTIVGVLSAETNTLASVADTLKIKLTEDGDATALEVVTSVENGTVVQSAPDADGVITYSVTVQTTFTIAFKVSEGDETPFFETNVVAGATGYGPAADPTKESTVATNFTFAGWTNAVAGGAAVATADLPAATGAATYLAVFTETVRSYTVTWVVDATTSNLVDVAYGAVPAYEGAAPAKEGYTFQGWSATDGGEVLASIPEVTGPATYYAVFEQNAVEPIPVTIGGDAVNALPAGTEPISLDATTGFTLRFAAKQTGVTYILQSATAVNGDFADVEVEGAKVSVTPTAVDEVVNLTDPDTSSTVKFYRVKVIVAE